MSVSERGRRGKTQGLAQRSRSVRVRGRRLLLVALVALAALLMADAARYGWGAATLGNDRVKWGLRSMGRSPLQPVIVAKDFCLWSDGPQGLCAMEPGSAWAAATFRLAAPIAWGLVAALAVDALVLALWPRAGRVVLGVLGVLILALGVAVVVASHRITVFAQNGLDPGWSGSFTWRIALGVLALASWLAWRRDPRPA